MVEVDATITNHFVYNININKYKKRGRESHLMLNPPINPDYIFSCSDLLFAVVSLGNTPKLPSQPPLLIKPNQKLEKENGVRDLLSCSVFLVESV